MKSKHQDQDDRRPRSGKERPAKREARRRALRQLSALPFQAVGQAIEEKTRALAKRYADFLEECDLDLHMAEHLARNPMGEDRLLTQLLGQHLKALKALISYIPEGELQRKARRLVAELLLLEAWLGVHRGQQPAWAQRMLCTALFTCGRDLEPALEYAILRRMAWVHETVGDGPGAWEIMEQALAMLEEDDEGRCGIPEGVRACIYAGAAVALSLCGQSAEEIRPHLERARQLLASPFYEIAHPPIYLQYHQGCLIFDEAMCAYYRGDYHEALDHLARIIDLEDFTPKVFVPSEFIKAAAVTRATLAMLKLPPGQRDPTHIKSLFREGIERTFHVRSGPRYRDLLDAYDLMKACWPQDRKIDELYEEIKRRIDREALLSHPQDEEGG
jgi:tetratricopeptide (TPR) repeat protein